MTVINARPAILGKSRAFSQHGGTTASAASAITSWVEEHFTATTVGGVTVYDLTSAAAG